MSKLAVFQQVRRFGWILVIGALAGSLGLLLFVLAGGLEKKVPVMTANAPPDVRPPTSFAIVERVRRPRSEPAVGTVRAVHEASVASKLLARVIEVRVKAGQTVNQGEVLVQLEDSDLRARVKQAEATFAAAQAMLERAARDQERADKLIKTNAISAAEHDQAVAARKSAEAEIQRASQSLEETKILLDYATIRAPLTGVVVDKRIESGDTATPGQVLVTLYEPDRMQLVATVRESLALRLHVGDRVPARLDALEHECLATVSEVVPQAESISRSFTVKVTGPCPPGAVSGMFGRISIPLDDEQVLIVPAAAIQRVGQLELVDVVVESTVRRRAVRIGRKLTEGYEVLAGLREGDRVALHANEEDAR